MADSNCDNGWTYVYVGNIPEGFRSADLRVFFSQFIESGGFHTFHFKHRPEHVLSENNFEEVGLGALKRSRCDTDKHHLTKEDLFPTRGRKFGNDEYPHVIRGQNYKVGESGTTGSNNRHSVCTRTTSNISNNNYDADIRNTRKLKSSCCVVKVYDHRLEEFIKLFTNSIWYDRRGTYYSTKIHFKVLVMGKSKSSGGSANENSDFDNLQEVNPPPEMPNGNVGTPLSVFMHLIRACKLPASIIQKLGLKFPKSFSKQRYGNVPFEYTDVVNRKSQVGDGTVLCSDKDSCIKSSSTHKNLFTEAAMTLTSGSTVEQTPETSSNHLKKGISASKINEMERHGSTAFTASLHTTKDTLGKITEACRIGGSTAEESESWQNDVEADAEDWERHEALHDDVDAQARTKERLFEEDIELKWEKGGSGLVFYTDAYYWHEMKGKDFDEETADDWDVDMSVYSESGGGDKDARDLLKIRVEDRWHKGLEEGPTDVSDFEKYTKGFGSQQLRKRGWNKGRGLGASSEGISDPVEAVGQSSRDKTGLGYLGVKLNRHPIKRRRAERDVVISTIYDEEKDSEGNALQRTGPDTLKYICTPVPFVRDSKAP